MEAKVKKKYEPFLQKLPLSTGHQNLVRIFGMFAFNAYICHVIDDFACFELQH